ncbi:MAG: cation-efflux pump [Actinomycetota bacterium]|nr:cation-efflux pump [Actinomycetota bacterium]
MEDAPGAAARRQAFAALVITVALAAGKLLVWATTGSLAVLSQALDSVLDIVALALVYVGIRIAGKPADRSHHYGHAKAENLVAFTQTLLLGGLVVWVAIGAVEALARPSGVPVDAPWYSFVVLGASAAIDAGRVRVLVRTARDARSDALWAGALNLVTDIGTAVIALLSLVLVRAGFDVADAIGALLVAGAVAVAAFRLGRRSVDVLMDRAPLAPVEAIEAAAARVAGVEETRRVRVRGTGDHLFADVTVAAGRTTSLERAHDIAENVEEEIARVVPSTDVVVHVEPISETTGMVERVQAAASRTPGVHEVHNVLIHAFDDRGKPKLHVTLHAKARTGISLEEAHSLSDEIEASVERELGADIRVDTHIEPLTVTSPGVDVTEDRSDLVRAVRALAVEEPDVLDCHEVLVTSSGSVVSVVAHVTGRRDLPLARMHDASDRIEKAIHAAHPDVGPVTIHFEPT